MTIHENALSNRAARYWNESITRKEIQPIFDAYGQAINALTATVQKQEMALAYLADKTGVIPEEFQTWLGARMTEFQAQATPATEPPAEAPVESPLVTLN